MACFCTVSSLPQPLWILSLFLYLLAKVAEPGYRGAGNGVGVSVCVGYCHLQLAAPRWSFGMGGGAPVMREGLGEKE